MKLYLIFICLLLSACSSLPPVIKDARVTDITYDQASEDLDGYKNSLVRWGGVIVSVENNENSSLMRVMYYPLDNYDRPQLNEPSAGRFVIRSQEYLNPERYSVDREVTVLGVIDSDIGSTVGSNTRDWVPLIKSTAIHLWPINYRSNYYGNCRSCYFRQLFW